MSSMSFVLAVFLAVAQSPGVEHAEARTADDAPKAEPGGSIVLLALVGAGASAAGIAAGLAVGGSAGYSAVLLQSLAREGHCGMAEEGCLLGSAVLAATAVLAGIGLAAIVATVVVFILGWPVARSEPPDTSFVLLPSVALAGTLLGAAMGAFAGYVAGGVLGGFTFSPLILPGAPESPVPVTQAVGVVALAAGVALGCVAGSAASVGMMAIPWEPAGDERSARDARE